MKITITFTGSTVACYVDYSMPGTGGFTASGNKIIAGSGWYESST